MEVVDEKSSCTVRVTFTDEKGLEVVPSSASYRIDDEKGSVYTEVKTDTSFTPASSVHDIEITDNENRILATANRQETRLVTLSWTYDTDKKGNAAYRYRVKNLAKVT